MAQSGVPITSESPLSSDVTSLEQSVLEAQCTVSTDLTLTAQTDEVAQCVRPSTSTGPLLSSASPSFRDVLAVPKKYGQAAGLVPGVKRSRKVGHAVVITTSPYKKALECMKNEKVKKQIAAEERKAAKTAKKELQMVKKIEKELQKKMPTESSQKAHIRNKVLVQSKERKRKKDKQYGEKTQPLQKRMRRSTHKPSDVDARCLYCAELFSQSANKEKWIQCEQCMQWAHTACGGVGDKDKHFRCELC